MTNGSGVSRGDRNRNARLARLRSAVPVTNAIVGIDLADRKQMVVVTDHDSKVLARRTFRCKAWDLGAALDWAAERAVKAGFAGVTVACEPTGHRWRVLGQLAARARDAVRVRATGGVVVGPPDRGPDHGQDRRQGRGPDRPPDRGSCAATCPNRSMRPGPGCGTWVPAATSCWVSTSRAFSRSATCSSACGQPPWRPRSSRSSRPPGSPR